MKLVVGLGNPGRRYAGTRHNVGFRVVDRFGQRHGIELSSRRFQGKFGRGRVGALDVGLLEPQEFMNLSGGSVAEALRFLPVKDPSCDLVVVLDDVDLPFGRLRVRPRGGDGGHRGLQDVIASLGRAEFARLRFGVGRPAGFADTSDHVLQRFPPEQEAELDVRLEDAADVLEAILAEGVTTAMNRFNRAPEQDLC